MTEEFVAPRYGDDALCNVLPSIMSRLEGSAGRIEIPAAHKYVVLMVDGLGWNILRSHASHAERLASYEARILTCSVPSTTACSLSSLGCGVPPGQHGVVGYTFLDPEVGAVINALTWERGRDDIPSFRQVSTRFEQLVDAGRPSAAVTLARFEGSALTQTAFAGTRLVARPDDETDVDATVACVAEALAGHDVVYCYQRLLDHAGHTHGVGSWQWLEQLEAADDLAAGLAALTGDDVCLLVTGDHGMVNVPLARRIVAEEEPTLAGFTHIAGEGRLRQLYGDDPRSLAASWARHLGERALVVRREEAIDAGWFGAEVTRRTASRIGDVLVAMRDDWAVMSTAFAKELTLVGMHGSLTPDELLVPLLAVGGRR